MNITTQHYSKTAFTKYENLNTFYAQDSNALGDWNSFFIEYIEALIANPFRYFQEMLFKKQKFSIDYTRFKKFIHQNYTGSYPDIQLYNFFAFLYAINYFEKASDIKKWKSTKHPFFMNQSFNDLIKTENGIVFLKIQLRKLPVLNS